MKYIISIIFSFLFIAFSGAQPLNKSTTASLTEAGDLAFEVGDYYNALEKYKEAYEEDNNTYIAGKRAACAFYLRDYEKAQKYFEVLLRKDKKKQQYTKEYRFLYAKTLKMNGDYEKAVEEFQLALDETEDEKLKTEIKNQLRGAEMAVEMIQPLDLVVAHAGSNVNNKHSEYAPRMTEDGTTMYYAAMEAKKVIVLDGNEGDYYLKIFESKKKGEEWGKGEALDLQVNRENWHTGNPALSPDGRRLYYTRALLEGNYVSQSKIYVSTMGDEGWGPARELIGINGNYKAQHPVVGELFGREVIFFTSDMEGGYGGNDIYYATYKGDDVYADPVNLGPKINTKGNEETPFYKEGILYYSSDGLPGIGGYDIFKTSWDGTGWSIPENMGMGYNSSVDDLFFTVDKEGYSGFLVSNRYDEKKSTKSVAGKTCCNDIYTFNIEKIESSIVVGSFVDKKPLPGTNFQLIEMTNNRPGKTSDKDSGQTNKAGFPLELEKAYMIIATKEGYFPDTVTINTVGLTESKQFTEFLFLKEKPKPPPPPVDPYETYTIDEPIELQNIFYKFDSDEFVEGAEDDLRIILDLMNQYADMKIELYSHTDSRGKDKYNMDLSQRRASAAKRWLVKNGIAASRMRAIGKGETEIRNRCVNKVKCEEEEHLYNRRTEFKIVEGPTTFKIEKKRLRKKTN